MSEISSTSSSKDGVFLPIENGIVIIANRNELNSKAIIQAVLTKNNSEYIKRVYRFQNFLDMSI